MNIPKQITLKVKIKRKEVRKKPWWPCGQMVVGTKPGTKLLMDVSNATLINANKGSQIENTNKK